MIVNLVSNLILVQFIGIYGVIISTILSMLIAIPWETNNVFKCVFHTSSRSYYATFLKSALLSVAVALITYSACVYIPDGWGGLILRGLICLILPNAVFCLVYKNTAEFGVCKELVMKKFFGFIKRKKLKLDCIDQGAYFRETTFGDERSGL